MQLSVVIEGSDGEVLDRDLDEIEIPDFTGPDLALSTPSFYVARNALQFRAIVDSLDVEPVAVREFRRTDDVLIRVESHAPGDVFPNVEARLLNRGGELIYPLDVRQAIDGHPHQVHLKPVSLPPGEYIVELRAITAEDDVTELVAFRLSS